MDHDVFIDRMYNGQEIEGFYLLNDAAVRTSANGKSFLSAKIADCSGAMEMKVWDYSGPIGAADSGKVIKIRGEVSEFKGALQMTAKRIRLADPDTDHFDLANLVPVAPIDVSSTFEEVRSLISGIEDEDYRKVCLTMLERHGDAFRSIPAAKSVHHEFLSGLLMHTSDMLRLADFLAYQYHEVIDRSLLLAGTFLHDFAKEKEFTFSHLGLVTDYSVKGKLLGHLVMGAQEIAEIAKELNIPEDKSVLLQHMVLSHHGEPEFGAAVIPQCAESELLSFIDRIDSRMEIYAEVFQQVPVGSFSNMIFSLDKKVYHHE